MRRLLTTTGFAITLLAGGCRTPAPHESILHDSILHDDVVSVLEEQQDAWNRGDLDSFLAGYERSEELTFSSASGTHRGWESVRERYRNRYPDREAMGTLTFSELEVTPLGPDSAYVAGRWRLQRKDDAPGGVFTVIFRRTPNGCRIIHDHTSAFPPK